MARIRTIKPEFWTDEKLSILDPITRLVFLGLISMADDAGRLVDSVRLVDGMLFPNTEDTCRDALDTLARMSRILRYRSSSGQALIQILNWERHQKVDNPNKYTLPGPESAVVIQPIVSSEDTCVTANPRDDLATSSRDPIVTTYDLRPTTNDLRSTTPDRAGGWIDALAALWKTHRKGRTPRELIASELAELHAEHGIEVLECAAQRFLLSDKAPYGVRFFAANFGDYTQPIAPKIVPNGKHTHADKVRATRQALRGTA